MEICQRKIISVKGKTQMRRVLCNLTKPARKDPARIIIDGEKQFISNVDKANVFIKYYHISVASSLKLTKDD